MSHSPSPHRPSPGPTPRTRPTDGLDTFLAVAIALAIAVAAWVIASYVFGLADPPDVFEDPDDPLDSHASALPLAPPADKDHTAW